MEPIIFRKPIESHVYLMCIKDHFSGRVSANNLVIVVTREDCPIISFIFETRLKNPYCETNIFHAADFKCEYEIGCLKIFLFNEREETLIIRVPIDFINTTISISENYCELIPEGLDLDCQILLPDYNGGISGDLKVKANPDVGCDYGSDSTFSSGNQEASKAFSDWMLLKNTGKRPPEAIENGIAARLAEEAREKIHNTIEGCRKHLIMKRERANYVHTDQDEKVFLFCFKERNNDFTHIAVTESGNSLCYGAGHSYESSIKDMEKHLYDCHWKLRVIKAEKGDPDLISALKKLKEEGSYKKELIIAASLP